jgi:hypothetical protein
MADMYAMLMKFAYADFSVQGDVSLPRSMLGVTNRNSKHSEVFE